jgi:hypothetical protein
LILLALFYAALSFAYSLTGFLHFEPASHVHEYSPSKLAIEVLGHFAFGFLASLPLFDFDLSLLTGSLAVLIDSDHILTALGFPVVGRPDHSILYAVVSLIALVAIGRKLNLPKQVLVKLAFVAPITVLSHIAYDVFASTGPTFPLFVPFDFGEIYIPYEFSYLLEALAFLLALLGYFVSRKYSSRKPPIGKDLISSIPQKKNQKVDSQ